MTLIILRRLFIPLLTLGLLLPATALHADDDHTPLGEQMEIIGKAFRSLRREVRDPANNESSAELVSQMLAASRKSLEFDPAWTADQPAAEQADFVAGYRQEMEEFIGLLEALHTALKAGDNDKAQELVGDLRSQQRSSHKAYKKPDED